MPANDWGSMDVGYGEKVYLKDVVQLVDRKELKKFSDFRPVGPIIQYRSLWITIFKDGKPMPGKKGKPLQIPFVVTNFNSEDQTYDEENPCPYTELVAKMNKHLGEKEQCYESPTILSNVIDRNAQENLPGKIKPPSSKEEKTGFRDIDSKHINPVKVMNFSSNEYRKVKGTIELNTVNLKSGEVTRGPNDTKFGYNIQLKFVEEEKVASDKLKINKGERCALTDEEKEYLLWDLEGAIKTQKTSQKEAQKDCDRLWREFEKFLKASGKSSTKKRDEDEDDDAPEDLDDEDNNKKSKNKNKKSDEDEDDDEKPKKKKKPQDDDDDEDDNKSKKKKKVEDDDDDEDVKPKKKKKKDEDDDEDEKPKKKKKPRDDDDDDEEEKSSKKGTKKKKRDEIDEDDDDDSDVDLDLDDD